ncbi:hypothetical protein PHLGIDRAFT_13669 [Phlebiopsis gigantea 11061_1 CR5-6]|uniref:Uncharacterized protein n=1 Tax=Phlebiopsis gigantea (strain 11061_1 CR5-6) TaxID=745531 RepID=A0A0C3S7G2_PHLG1|nr:hypothetical protein PHLGIDRAFT_13669 [Phlebiopsis gigantea 11061_1 CR5-6]
MSGPIILTLDSWAEQRLQAVLQSTSKQAFDVAFDAFISPLAQITLNGENVSRADYGTYLWKAQAHERSATVDFKGVVAVPKDQDALIQTGEVGLFFVSNINQPPLLFSEVVTASLNLIVDQPTDQPAGVDKRSVASLTQVSTERPSNVKPLPGQ